MPIHPWKYKERTLRYEEWEKEGIERFGEDKRKWTYICVMCGTPQSFYTFQEHTKAPVSQMLRYLSFSCVGRLSPEPKIGCDWTLGGFLSVHTLTIIPPEGRKDENGELFKPQPCFEFYEDAIKSLSGIDAKTENKTFSTRDQRTWKVQRLKKLKKPGMFFSIIQIIDGIEQLKNRVKATSYKKALERYLKNEDREKKHRNDSEG